MLQDLLQGFRELIFPHNCVSCRTYLPTTNQTQLCSYCFTSIKLNTPPFCLKCSRHLTIFNDLGLCQSCLKSNYAFDIAWGCCTYEQPLSDFLHSFKYHSKTHFRKVFEPLMLNFIDSYSIPVREFDMIIPIPLHPTRYRERGYNQAYLLSQIIAKHYDLPLQDKILQRSKYTQTQTKLEAKQRWTNLSDAFRIDSFQDIADKKILIVDDLLTTGATMDAASKALKNSKASYIGALTLGITQ